MQVTMVCDVPRLCQFIPMQVCKTCINVPNVSYKSCTLLWYFKKEKYLHKIALFTFTQKSFFPGLPNLAAQIRCTQN